MSSSFAATRVARGVRPAAASNRIVRARVMPRPGAMELRGRNVAARAAQVSVAGSAGGEPAASLEAAAAAASAPAAADKDGMSGAMLEPSAANKQWVRVLATLAVTAAVASSSVFTPGQGWRFVALLAWGTWLGATIFNTFVVGLTMFKNMPRQMFGRVQSKMFPQYFMLTTAANLVLLAGAVVLGAPQGSVVTLGVAGALNVVNWLFIEPKCTGLMFARYEIENKEGKTEEDQAAIKSLYGKFGMWHGISSLNNLVTLACSVAYGWTLAAAMAL